MVKDEQIPPPKRLQFAFSPDAQSIIQQALIDAKKAIDNLDLVVTRFNTFGKGKVKKLNISPDAFIQTRYTSIVSLHPPALCVLLYLI